MAEENQDGQEKTEEPTQRRLDKAAEEGRVLTSKEVMVFTSLAMGLVLYLALGPFMWSGLSAWGGLFVIDSALNLDTLGLVKVRYAFWLVILVTLIVGIPLMIVTLLTQIGVGGLNFSTQALHFKGNRIDPLAGLKRIFSVKGLVELAKSILKVALLFGIGGIVIYMQLPELIQLSASSLGLAIERASAAVPYLIGGLLVGLFIIAVIDFAWQRHTHTQSLRMTIKEVKDESRQTRRLAGSARQNTAHAISTISGIFTAARSAGECQRCNGGHYQPDTFCRCPEICIRPDGGAHVLAMGRGVIAQQIIEKAEEHDVRTLRIPMLARALFFTSEIGGEITEGLYNAVAVILAYVFRINNDETLEMPDLTLPPELRFDEYGNLETEAN